MGAGRYTGKRCLAGHDSYPDDPQTKKAREDLIPLSRIGDPKDIANAIEFLISPLSSYITGQDLCVDGGFTKSILSHIPGRPSSKPQGA